MLCHSDEGGISLQLLLALQRDSSFVGMTEIYTVMGTTKVYERKITSERLLRAVASEIRRIAN